MPLGPGQVRVAVRAAGLNFRDVLIALGMYPGEAGLLGSEVAGVVLEVGPGVEALAAGDRVLGLVRGRFGPVAVTDARLLARVPAGWSFAQAASVPVAFLTAYYGLVDLAGLRPGESVLVHAAAGGVGMAAVQLARHLGARGVRDGEPGQAGGALRGLGVPGERIASSRDLGFAGAFPGGDRRPGRGRGAELAGRGVRGRVAAAAGRAAAGSSRWARPTSAPPGKSAAAIPAVAAYQAFDLMEAGPDRIRQMLAELGALFAAGVLDAAAGRRAWDVRRAPEAFRFMSQARHTGKIVLTVPRPLDPAGTVLITGGTGGLGAVAARHLADRARGAAPAAGQPARRRGRPGPRSWPRSWTRAGARGHGRGLRRGRPGGAGRGCWRRSRPAAR